VRARIAQGAPPEYVFPPRIAAWERSDEAADLDRLTPAFWNAAARWLLEWTKRTITEDAS